MCRKREARRALWIDLGPINEAALSEVPQARFVARAANCACSSTVILRTSHERAARHKLLTRNVIGRP
jgi:hypothetical protein